MEPLVSVITPCYNVEHKIKNYLDSMLEQTYKNVEFIIINDGSTDNTEKVILSYKDKFIEKGYKFIFRRQKNSGQDVALNNGLKLFNGDYLMWTDSDDILEKDNIKEKVNYLEENKDCGLVFCDSNIISSKKNVLDTWKKKLPINKYELFEDIVIANDVIYAGGAWMLRSKFFLSLKPERNIEILKVGQNGQMLLPMVYNFPVGKINKILFNYVIYNDSHSHIRRSYEEYIERIKGINKAMITILSNIRMGSDYKKYLIQRINHKTDLDLLDIMINFNKIESFRGFYNNIDKSFIGIKRRCKYKLYMDCHFIYVMIKRIKNYIKSRKDRGYL